MLKDLSPYFLEKNGKSWGKFIYRKFNFFFPQKFSQITLWEFFFTVFFHDKHLFTTATIFFINFFV